MWSLHLWPGQLQQMHRWVMTGNWQGGEVNLYKLSIGNLVNALGIYIDSGIPTYIDYELLQFRGELGAIGETRHQSQKLLKLDNVF